MGVYIQCVYIYICIYVCICVYIYVCICIYVIGSCHTAVTQYKRHCDFLRLPDIKCTASLENVDPHLRVSTQAFHTSRDPSCLAGQPVGFVFRRRIVSSAVSERTATVLSILVCDCHTVMSDWLKSTDGITHRKKFRFRRHNTCNKLDRMTSNTNQAMNYKRKKY